MRLDEFIKETLLQIAKGVQGAIDEQNGFEVNPIGKEWMVKMVKFNIAIETDTKAGAGIKVISGSVESKTVNTVEFEVPIKLPQTNTFPKNAIL